MPTLILSDSFSTNEKVIFTKSFRAACEYLKIEDYTFSAQVKKEWLGNSKKEAQMAYVRDENLAMIELNSNGFSLGAALPPFCHEMIHVCQSIRNHLIDRDDGSVTWRGKTFPRFIAQHPAFYDQVPWELEAHGFMGKVFRHVLAALTPLERAQVEQTLHPKMMERLEYNERAISRQLDRLE